MLTGVYGAEMPYIDPHTAGPALWALRHRDGCDFECSAAPVAGGRQELLAAEAVAITMHRAEFGASPAFNFGRMPPGYRKSSGNNARLAASGRRFRGGVDLLATTNVPGVPIPGPLDSPPTAGDWVGLAWTEWRPLTAAIATPRTAHGSRGVYRLRDADAEDLLYVGQGVIGSRLAAHARAASRRGTAKNGLFGAEVEASWVPRDDLPTRCLLEIENDLIASHVLVRGRPPAAQFLG
jgi:hypothetical protein